MPDRGSCSPGKPPVGRRCRGKPIRCSGARGRDGKNRSHPDKPRPGHRRQRNDRGLPWSSGHRRRCCATGPNDCHDCSDDAATCSFLSNSLQMPCIAPRRESRGMNGRLSKNPLERGVSVTVKRSLPGTAAKPECEHPPPGPARRGAQQYHAAFLFGENQTIELLVLRLGKSRFKGPRGLPGVQIGGLLER